MIKKVIVASMALITLSFIGTTLVPSLATAQNTRELCSGAELDLGGDTGCDTGSEGTLNDLIATIVNVFSVIVGVVAVVMIILAGFRYITSGGDSGKVGSAKSALIYALVGLIIVALAQVIVRFVLSSLR